MGILKGAVLELTGLRHWVVGLMARAAFGLLWLMPPAMALACLGSIFGLVGPMLGKTRRMRRTIDLAFPGLTKPEREARVKKVWTAFGRTVATIPHLGNFVAGRRGAGITVRNLGVLQELGSRAAIVCGAHVGNWEVTAAMPKGHTRKVMVSYKPAANPIVEKVIQNYRAQTGTGFVPKEQIPRLGAQTLRNGEVMYFTIDQRVEPGERISFLGLPAMASRFPARLAVKYDCPIIPVEAIWQGGASYETVFHPPLYPDKSIADPDVRARDLMVRMFREIEAMVIRRPDEWFCLKPRWSREERLAILADRPGAEREAARLRG